MGRHPSVDHDELAVFLEKEGRPVPSDYLAKQFDCTRPTITRHCRLARQVDGYPIFPTAMGQIYLARIRTADDLNLFLGMQQWSAKMAAASRKINGEVRGRISAVPPRQLERLQDQIEG